MALKKFYKTDFDEGKIYFWTWWLCRPNESSISVAFRGINTTNIPEKFTKIKKNGQVTTPASMPLN